MTKEIIIDGCNVAECSEYSKYREGYCGWYMSCKQQGSCSFKLNWLKSEIKRLQKENEQLKKTCLVMPKVNQLAVPIDKYEKLYKALEEIKEIAKYNQFYNPKYFMLRGDIGQIQNIKMTEIYEKCNEALNDRN